MLSLWPSIGLSQLYIDDALVFNGKTTLLTIQDLELKNDGEIKNKGNINII